MGDFVIGGYAVVLHGGDELSDWDELRAILPTKEAGLTHVRSAIGASSLDEAFERRENMDRRHGIPSGGYQYGSIHAVSPEFGKRVAAALKGGEDAPEPSQVKCEIADFQHPHYTVRDERVICTYKEAENYAELRRPKGAAPSHPAAVPK